jgi:hypothetical protein
VAAGENRVFGHDGRWRLTSPTFEILASVPFEIGVYLAYLESVLDNF